METDIYQELLDNTDRSITVIDRAMRSGPPAYANRALPQAVTVVPSSHLRDGRPITAAELGRQDRRELERAPQARASTRTASTRLPSDIQGVSAISRKASGCKASPASTARVQANSALENRLNPWNMALLPLFCTIDCANYRQMDFHCRCGISRAAAACRLRSARIAAAAATMAAERSRPNPCRAP